MISLLFVINTVTAADSLSFVRFETLEEKEEEKNEDNNKKL